MDTWLLFVNFQEQSSLSLLFFLPSSFFDLAGLFSATLAAALVIYAVMKIRQSRLEAYRLFKNAVLVQIFMVQVFLFYRVQLLALLGLARNICVLLLLKYMIRQEMNAEKGMETSGS